MNKKDWRNDVFDVFVQQNIQQVVYVPDAGQAALIDRCLNQASMKTGPLTNEFEGVGVCAGAWLGGERSVLLMQSSGVGNIINALGLVRHCQMPFFTLVTMRGEWGEFNPWQLHMGQSSQQILEASGVIVERASSEQEIADIVEAGLQLAFQSYCQVAVLVSQRVIGAKVFK